MLCSERIGAVGCSSGGCDVSAGVGDGLAAARSSEMRPVAVIARGSSRRPRRPRKHDGIAFLGNECCSALGIVVEPKCELLSFAREPRVPFRGVARHCMLNADVADLDKGRPAARALRCGNLRVQQKSEVSLNFDDFRARGINAPRSDSVEAADSEPPSWSGGSQGPRIPRKPGRTSRSVPRSGGTPPGESQ